MNLSGDLFVTGQLWFFNLMLLPILYLTYKKLPWSFIVNDKGLQHRFLGATLLLMIVWRITMNVDIGISVHFLGITTMTLVFGWPLAMVAALCAQLGFIFTDFDQLDTFSLNFLLSGVLPIWFTWRVHLFIESYQSKNPFVYIMITGFFNGLAATTLVGTVAIFILYLGGDTYFILER